MLLLFCACWAWAALLAMAVRCCWVRAAARARPPRLANSPASLSIAGSEAGNAVFVRFCDVGESADVVGVHLQLTRVFAGDGVELLCGGVERFGGLDEEL